MKLSGTCDFCGKEFDQEGLIIDGRTKAKHRSKGYAAIFPWTIETLPEGCTFATEDLKKHDIETRATCKNCYRK